MWANLDTKVLTRLPRKPAASTDAPTWSQSAAKLDQFRTGAAAIPPALLDSACRLAKVLESHGVAAPQWTLPWVDGWVLFEWGGPDGSTVTIEVTTPTCAEVTLVSNNNSTERLALTEGGPAA